MVHYAVPTVVPRPGMVPGLTCDARGFGQSTYVATRSRSQYPRPSRNRQRPRGRVAQASAAAYAMLRVNRLTTFAPLPETSSS